MLSLSREMPKAGNVVSSGGEGVVFRIDPAIDSTTGARRVVYALGGGRSSSMATSCIGILGTLTPGEVEESSVGVVALGGVDCGTGFRETRNERRWRVIMFSVVCSEVSGGVSGLSTLWPFHVWRTGLRLIGEVTGEVGCDAPR